METIDNGMYKEIYTLEVKSEDLCKAMELLHGIYKNKLGCVFYFSGNKKHMQAANILVVKKIKILTVNDKEVKTYEGNQKSITVSQRRADGIAITSAPTVKASNHTVDVCYGIKHYPWADGRFNYSGETGHYTSIHFLENTFGGDLLDLAADQIPESYSHQVFIDYTNENTNRVC